MKKNNRILVLLMAAILTAAMFVGCASSGSEETVATVEPEQGTAYLPSSGMDYMASADEETTDQEYTETTEATEAEDPCTPVYATVFGDVAVLSLEPLEEYDAMYPNYPSQDISNGGTIGFVGDYEKMLLITQVVILDELTPCSTTCWFENLENLETIVGLEKLNTAYVADMSRMFYNCGIEELDLSLLDTSAVTDMQEFMGMPDYLAENHPQTAKRVSFAGCDLSNVTDASNMFAWNVALEAVDFTGTNFAPQKMEYTFSRCDSLREVRGLKTCNAVNLYGAFFLCKSLEVLDVEWNFANAEIMDCMLTGCESLQSIDVSDWVFGKEITMRNLFSGCKSLKTLDVGGWDMRNVRAVNAMFAGCSSLEALDVAAWDLSNARIGDLTGYEDYGLGMFENCVSLGQLDLTSWETKSFEDMSYMFQNCVNLTSVGDLSGWHTGNTIGMVRMFAGCSSLTTLGDLSGWKTVRLEWSGYMFEGCDSLDQIPDWYTPAE